MYENFSVKEKMLIAAILNDYWERLNNHMQKQIPTLSGSDPISFNIFSLRIKNNINDGLIKVKNWKNLEIGCLKLSADMIELSVISNYAWKEMDSEKKNKFILNIKIFLLNADSVIFGDTPCLVKPISDTIWLGIFNNLNS